MKWQDLLNFVMSSSPTRMWIWKWCILSDSTRVISTGSTYFSGGFGHVSVVCDELMTRQAVRID